MKPGLMIALAAALLAFAGNSLLGRAALSGELISAESFSLIRLLSGAATLSVLAGIRGHHLLPSAEDLPGVLSLFGYIALFSLAYLSLDAGLGALILFGAVQVTVLVAAILKGQKPGLRSAAGMALAGGGLVWLLAPSGGSHSITAALMMAGAGVSWGLYTVNGKAAGDPLARTARNFVGAAPLALLPVLLFGASPLSGTGVMLAVLSGAVTSGLGYALWYGVVPRLSTISTGTSQLLVPPLTAVLGAVLLGEALTAELVLASGVVLGGIALTFGGRPAYRGGRPRGPVSEER